jgi:hypothetical protein
MVFIDLIVLLGVVSITSVWVDRRFIRKTPNNIAATSTTEKSQQA